MSLAFVVGPPYQAIAGSRYGWTTGWLGRPGANFAGYGQGNVSSSPLHLHNNGCDVVVATGHFGRFHKSLAGRSRVRIGEA